MSSPEDTDYCPVCLDVLMDDWCNLCEYEVHRCGTCRKVFDDESDAGDCEYDHRTVLDDLADVVD
jgi:hypothetical protein